MKKFVFTIGALALLGSNCGGGGDGAIDEGPSATEGTADPAAMKSTVTQADSLNAAIAAQSGEQIAGAAVALSVGAMGAVRGGTSKALTVEKTIADTMAGSDMTTGTKTCTPTGCTFEGFGNGQFKISGSVTAADAMGAKHIVWALSGSATNLGASSPGTNLNFEFTWKGDLTASATSLNGAAGATWVGSGTAEGQSFTFNYGSVLKFQNITITDHCPTAGSVFGKWWVSAQSGGQSKAEAVQATHTFNGCAK
jgi:hypothetical protein